MSGVLIRNVRPVVKCHEIEGLGALTPYVMAELTKGTLAKQAFARKRQQAIQRVRGQQGAVGDGHCEMMIPPESYHYWGQRLGYECWQDKAFCLEYLRDNPECRVKYVPKSPVISVGRCIGRG